MSGPIRMTARDSAHLAIGSAIAGVFAYVFFMLASRYLGAERAAPVSVLWSFWAMSAAVLTFPVQHWIIRKFTVGGHETNLARALPPLCVVVAVLAAGAGLLAFLFRGQIFGGDEAAFPMLVAGVTAGSFFIGVVRGVLSGRGRHGATALSLAAENGLRVVAAVVATLAGGGAVAFGVALVIGPLVALSWLPSLHLGPRLEHPGRLRDSLSLLSGVAGGSLIGQVVLTGAPVVLAAAGGAPPSVTSLFLALSVWRAPYIVAMGMAPRLTVTLTTLVTRGRAGSATRIARVTGLVVVGCAVVAALLGMTVLAPILQLAFGADVRLDRYALAGVGIGTVLALGNLVLLLVLLALGRSRMTTLAWLAALGAAAIWMWVGQDVAPVARVLVAFVAAEVVAFGLLELAIERSSPRRKSPGADDLPAVG